MPLRSLSERGIRVKLKTMLEDLRQEFPNVSHTQLLFEINKAMREFSARTGIFHGVVLLTRINDMVSEDADKELTIYTMPANVYELNGVDELNRDLYELRDDELYIWCVDPTIEELTVRYFALPAPIANESESPPFEERFHDALLNMVRRKLYGKQGNINGVKLEDAYVREAEREARRYVNTSPYRNTGAFSGADMNVIIAFGTMDLAAGENTVNLSPKVFSSLTYTVMLNGNGIQVEEYDPNNNHDQRTTSSFKVMSADTNTNFEYFVVGT